MARNERANLAKETLRIIDQGEYTLPSGKRVTLRDDVARAKAGTRLYDAGAANCQVARKNTPTAIAVTAETTCEAIARMANSGQSHLCAINFASAKNPGGGFLGGAQAQEEALARSSALYPCLLTQPSYYERNRANRSALYLDLAIYSPSVPFFRDDAGNLLEQPSRASVITAPAPNAGAVGQNQPHELPLVPKTLRQRAELVLAIAAIEKVDRLILGAWGCGVFRNDPAVVADTFADLLLNDGRFRDVFGDIVFAVYDRTAGGSTIAAFRDRFTKTK